MGSTIIAIPMNACFLWLRAHLLHLFVLILAMLVIIAGCVGLFLVAQSFNDEPQSPTSTIGTMPEQKNPPISPNTTLHSHPAMAQALTTPPSAAATTTCS